jgi:hypothetical protein
MPTSRISSMAGSLRDNAPPDKDNLPTWEEMGVGKRRNPNPEIDELIRQQKERERENELRRLPGESDEDFEDRMNLEEYMGWANPDEKKQFMSVVAGALRTLGMSVPQLSQKSSTRGGQAGGLPTTGGLQ